MQQIITVGNISDGKTQSRTVYMADGICPTLCSGMDHGNTIPYVIEIKGVDKVNEQNTIAKSREEQRLGCLNGFGGGSFAGQVYEKDGLAPTLTDMQGGGRQPHIVETQRIICAMRGRNKKNPSDRTPGIELEQRLEPQEDGICNTLTSVQKDNLVLESECLGGFGDKKSNGGTQYYQHYRVYSMGDVALCLPSQIPGGSYNYLEKKQIIYDDYNSNIPEDQSVSPTLTTNCGASALRNGVKMIKVRQATKEGFALCELGGGGGFGLSIIGNSQRQGDRERTDKPDADNGEYP